MFKGLMFVSKGLIAPSNLIKNNINYRSRIISLLSMHGDEYREEIRDGNLHEEKKRKKLGKRTTVPLPPLGDSGDKIDIDNDGDVDLDIAQDLALDNNDDNNNDINTENDGPLIRTRHRHKHDKTIVYYINKYLSEERLE